MPNAKIRLAIAFGVTLKHCLQRSTLHTEQCRTNRIDFSPSTNSQQRQVPSFQSPFAHVKHPIIILVFN